jgi:hypothetical protein
MANPTSRNELIDYCLRRLGAPVIEINVDDDQLEDRIDEALQFYQTYHSDAIIKTYVKHQITAFDVANGYIDLDNKYTYVRRILPLGDENSSINMFDARYQMSLNDVYNLRGGSLSGIDSYYQTQQYVSTLSLLLDGTPAVRFSRHQDRLHIDVDWGEDIKEDDYIIIDADAIIDPGSFSDVYNDMWLKRYATALIKEQWGQNISKFEGMQLPGGVILNGRAIMEDARTEIEKLEEEIRMNFEMPVDFYVG